MKYIMVKDKKLEIRVSQEELDYIDKVCAVYGISRSEFIRQAIRGDYNINSKGIAQKIYAMQTIVNKMLHVDATESEINSLVKEMNELWQFLN